ncbi:MAG TPA: UDP-glucose/GDP-mannose dehydrogenase family protein, partial [Acidimicrobiales bacterium]|nr:UDP-glucose/GDP-mannose dehydrogenase family protein [Acidimicrobiales bacterium]
MPPGVTVIGTGYVGAVVAACLAWLGRDVLAVESDQDRLDSLRRGRVPFFEPGLEEVLRESLASGRLQLTDSVAGAVARAEVIFLCLGTPTGPDGRADMRATGEAAAAIGASLASPRVVVTKSTVPIGAGHWIESVIDDHYGGAQPISALLSVVSCPEFLREGSAVEDFLHPERIVVGSDDPLAIEEVAAVYEPILRQSFPGGRPGRLPGLVRTGLTTAETAKYASNAFLATKVSFINEIAGICEAVGADVNEVASAMGLDSRIGGAFLRAGVGWGGSCFGKDLTELMATATDCGRDPRLLRAVRDVNHGQRRAVVDRLRERLSTLQGRRIALLGLAFKPWTDDIRDAPAVDVATRLIGCGARVTAHDPVVPGVPFLPDLRLVGDVMEAVGQADAVVLMTEWPEYAAIDWAAVGAAMRGRTVIDGRNVLDPAVVAQAGLDYDGMGRRPEAALPRPPASDGLRVGRPVRRSPASRAVQRSDRGPA